MSLDDPLVTAMVQHVRARLGDVLREGTVRIDLVGFCPNERLEKVFETWLTREYKVNDVSFERSGMDSVLVLTF